MASLNCQHMLIEGRHVSIVLINFSQHLALSIFVSNYVIVAATLSYG